MIDRLTNYRTRYGYPTFEAIIAEFWWRLEHLPGYANRTEPPMWWQRIVSFAYRQRKAWEDPGRRSVPCGLGDRMTSRERKDDD